MNSRPGAVSAGCGIDKAQRQGLMKRFRALPIELRPSTQDDPSGDGGTRTRNRGISDVVPSAFVEPVRLLCKSVTTRVGETYYCALPFELRPNTKCLASQHLASRGDGTRTRNLRVLNHVVPPAFVTCCHCKVFQVSKGSATRRGERSRFHGPGTRTPVETMYSRRHSPNRSVRVRCFGKAGNRQGGVETCHMG